MEESHVVENLVAIVPGVQRPVPRVVVEHGQVAVLVDERDVDVLVRRGVGRIRVVHLGAAGVAVGDVQRSADHEGLSRTALGVVGGPAADDLQRIGAQLAEDDVPRVLIGGVHGPEPALIHHEVDVGVAAPGVVVHVVVARKVQLASAADERGAQVEADDGVALELVVVDGTVVHHLARAGPGVGQTVGREVVRGHEVFHGRVLTDKAVVMVAVHVPHLNGERGTRP